MRSWITVPRAYTKVIIKIVCFIGLESFMRYIG
jgi:hypothetical protein